MNTMSYSYKMHVPAAQVFRTIMAEQLKYFQAYDASITALEVGTVLHNQMKTKTQRTDVPTTFEVTDIQPNRRFALTVSYAVGAIKTRYVLETQGDVTLVRYEEDNSFTQARNDLNFAMIGTLYKFMYKRNLKKRMKYIEQLAQPAAQ